MTSKLTRERLSDILEFGSARLIKPISDEEIELMARMALAAMNGEPFAYIIQDKYERERGVEGHLSRSHVSKYVSQEDINEHEITCIPLYRHAQPAPVVPEEWTIADAVKFCKETGRQDAGAAMDAWNACRAAMLQTKSLTSINPAPDLVSLQKKAESIIGNYPGIPDCWCRTCRPVVLNDMRFVVCPDCGNKRCPRANDHRNACTGSNEPGQEGSAYPDTLHESKP
ncbi:hypothetical protein [Klebsiella pneumoniae]